MQGDFDYEQRKQYNFLVIAYDNRNRTFYSSCRLHLIVIDEDDNRPKFKVINFIVLLQLIIYSLFINKDSILNYSLNSVVVYNKLFKLYLI